MKFKFLFGALVLVASLSFAGPAAAQTHQGPPAARSGQGGPRRGMGGMEAGIFKQLKLTAKQKTKIAAIQKWRMDSMRKMFPGRRPGGQAGPPRNGPPQGAPPPGGRRQFDPKMRAKFEAIRTQYDAKLKKVLTATQYKKYHSLMDAERAKMRQGRRRGGGPGGPGRSA